MIGALRLRVLLAAIVSLVSGLWAVPNGESTAAIAAFNDVPEDTDYVKMTASL